MVGRPPQNSCSTAACKRFECFRDSFHCTKLGAWIFPLDLVLGAAIDIDVHDACSLTLDDVDRFDNALTAGYSYSRIAHSMSSCGGADTISVYVESVKTCREVLTECCQNDCVCV